ncbi:hypothetical protein BDR22DRAFT_281277 [Usnea florida]
MPKEDLLPPLMMKCSRGAVKDRHNRPVCKPRPTEKADSAFNYRYLVVPKAPHGLPCLFLALQSETVVEESSAPSVLQHLSIVFGYLHQRRVGLLARMWFSSACALPLMLASLSLFRRTLLVLILSTANFSTSRSIAPICFKQSLKPHEVLSPRKTRGFSPRLFHLNNASSSHSSSSRSFNLIFFP